mmetsp:Transcript_151863/g.268144  ORF Transcript_151863/g.268144 Transcript_151863/m.268144 type:complete len:269 (+) Transcript_151863:53-859(+)
MTRDTSLDELPPLPILLNGIYADVFKKVDVLISSVRILDPAHNMVHIRAVTDHVRRALAAEPLDPHREALLVLAALLHEADDPKLFGTSDDANTRKILSDCLTSDDGAEGDTGATLGEASAVASEDAGVAPGSEWKLIVRDADRIEAIGEVGIARCYAFNQKVGSPLYRPTTPRAVTQEELWAIATPARFAAYSGDSDSMIDHYYDKLLHLSRCGSGNSYLEAKQQARLQEMIDFVLAFGKTGEVDVPALEAYKDAQRGMKRPAPSIE